jgi:DNA anti-recombination protein RmuC
MISRRFIERAATLSALSAAVVFGVAGCAEEDSTVDVTEEVSEAVDAIMTKAEETREEFLAGVEDRFGKLETEWTLKQEAARATAEEVRSDLAEKREQAREAVDEGMRDVRRKIEDLKQASKDRWREIKPEIESALDKLDRALSDLRDSSSVGPNGPDRSGEA